MIDIEKYLKEYCNGSKAEFARAFNRLPQNVTKLFNDPEKWLVVFEKDNSVHLLVQVRGCRVI